MSPQFVAKSVAQCPDKMGNESDSFGSLDRERSRPQSRDVSGIGSCTCHYLLLCTSHSLLGLYIHGQSLKGKEQYIKSYSLPPRKQQHGSTVPRLEFSTCSR